MAAVAEGRATAPRATQLPGSARSGAINSSLNDAGVGLMVPTRAMNSAGFMLSSGTAENLAGH